MCGRFTLRTKLNVLLQQFHAEVRDEVELPPRYNIAPTQDVAVVKHDEAGRVLTTMRWGLLPSWTKDPKKAPVLNNARAETVAEKPLFRSAFKSRRCLIPVSGFYEWLTVGKAKQPYLFRRPDDQLFAFAGLWEACNDIESCTIITTEANELMAEIHDRMPVILSPNDYEVWFDSSTTDAAKLLVPCPPVELTSYPVNPIVNNARNQGPDCIEPTSPRS